jgi:hypothetical protein
MTLNELYEQIGAHLKANPEHGELKVLQPANGLYVQPINVGDLDFDRYSYEKMGELDGDEWGDCLNDDNGEYIWLY